VGGSDLRESQQVQEKLCLKMFLSAKKTRGRRTAAPKEGEATPYGKVVDNIGKKGTHQISNEGLLGNKNF